MADCYDVIVLGLGGVGSAALYHLAANGAKVLGIDQFQSPHAHGSSHGQTRVIRQAYFEHPDYVPMLREAYRLWRELESQVDERLFHQTGLIEIGPPDGMVIPGVLRAAKEHDLAIEQLTFREAQQQFPGIAGSESWAVVVEMEAGYLAVERCVAAHLDQANRLGAATAQEQVVSWTAKELHVEVRTQSNQYQADRLIVAAGPWAAELLGQHGIPLHVLRKHIHWFATPNEHYQQKSGFPSYFFETPTGFYYGTPVTGHQGLKVARHSGGERVATLAGDRHQRCEADLELCQTFLHKQLPFASGPPTHWAGCYYTMSPDEHFIVDRLPDQPNVVTVAGLSGHGFKFTSVLGKLAAELALAGETKIEIDFLGLKRLL